MNFNVKFKQLSQNERKLLVVAENGQILLFVKQ